MTRYGNTNPASLVARLVLKSVQERAEKGKVGKGKKWKRGKWERGMKNWKGGDGCYRNMDFADYRVVGITKL